MVTSFSGALLFLSSAHVAFAFRYRSSLPSRCNAIYSTVKERKDNNINECGSNNAMNKTLPCRLEARAPRSRALYSARHPLAAFSTGSASPSLVLSRSLSSRSFGISVWSPHFFFCLLRHTPRRSAASTATRFPSPVPFRRRPARPDRRPRDAPTLTVAPSSRQSRCRMAQETRPVHRRGDSSRRKESRDSRLSW
jgi:hypothetical protein